MADDQVADFASSMLAAISCWHYRARALLSAPFTTDDADQKRDATELQATPREDTQTSTQLEEPRDICVEEAVVNQVAVEMLPRQDCVPQADDEQLEQDRSQHPESPASPSLPSGQPEAEGSEPEETSSRGIGGGEEEEGENDCSGVQLAETSILTNGELSEEGEEVVTDRKNILPCSVLDQASVGAGHFFSSLSRSVSLVSEDFLACPSPQMGSQTSNNPSSLCMQLQEDTQVLVTPSPEPQQLPEANLSAPAHDPGPNLLVEAERKSTLSQQDRLLIHKIRSYYEHAEDQDADFSIKRRESLSYIPTGLVRQLSNQLNCVPQDQAIPVHKKSSSHNRPTSWSVFDLPGLDKNQGTETHDRPKPQTTPEVISQSINEASTTDEVFRPASDMVKVWQDMEVNECLEQTHEVLETREETPCDLRIQEAEGEQVDSDTLNDETREEPLRILEESEMSPVSEEPSVSGHTTPFPVREEGYVLDSWLGKTPKCHGRGRVARAPLPRIISLRSGIEEDQILQDMGKMKNKVFQLARQYSQRIKNNRPVIRQRNRESENQLATNNLPAVLEEKTQRRDRGKPSLTPPFNIYEQVTIHELPSPSPSQTSSSGASSRVTSPCPPLATSPQSPLQSETLHWPDVQELRSKYIHPRLGPEASRRSKVCRSWSVPESMLECCTVGFGSSSWNPAGYAATSCNGSADAHRTLTDSPETRCVGSPAGDVQPQTRPSLCRWRSLDHMLGTLPLHEVQNLQEPVRTCYIAGQATGPNEHKIIIVERVSGAKSEDCGKTGGRELATRGKGKVQDRGSLLYERLDCGKKSAALSSGKRTERNLVRNLREKFQSLSSSGS